MNVQDVEAYDVKGNRLGGWRGLDCSLTWALDLARQTWPGAVRVEVDGKEHKIRGEQ